MASPFFRHRNLSLPLPPSLPPSLGRSFSECFAAASWRDVLPPPPSQSSRRVGVLGDLIAPSHFAKSRANYELRHQSELRSVMRAQGDCRSPSSRRTESGLGRPDRRAASAGGRRGGEAGDLLGEGGPRETAPLGATGRPRRRSVTAQQQRPLRCCWWQSKGSRAADRLTSDGSTKLKPI